MDFKERLKYLREEKQLTQKECAAELSVDYSNYNKWENGSNPNFSTLIKIARYFNVTTDYLLGVSECKQADSEKVFQEIGLLEGAVEVLRILNSDGEPISCAMLRFINSLILESNGAWEQLSINADAYEYTKNHIPNTTLEIREILPNGEEKISAYDARQLRLYACQEWIKSFIDGLNWKRGDDTP